MLFYRFRLLTVFVTDKGVIRNELLSINQDDKKESRSSPVICIVVFRLMLQLEGAHHAV